MSLAMSGCSDRPPDAVGLTVSTGSSVAKILTKGGQISCVRGLDVFLPQTGSLIGQSHITEKITRIKPGDRLHMTRENNSGDVIVRDQDGGTIAILRKDRAHKFESFRGVYPDNFCDQK